MIFTRRLRGEVLRDYKGRSRSTLLAESWDNSVFRVAVRYFLQGILEISLIPEWKISFYPEEDRSEILSRRCEVTVTLSLKSSFLAMAIDTISFQGFLIQNLDRDATLNTVREV